MKKKLLALLSCSLLSVIMVAGCANNDQDPPPEDGVDVEDPATNNGDTNGTMNNGTDGTNGNGTGTNNGDNGDINTDGDGDMMEDNNDQGEDMVEDGLDMNDKDNQDK